MLSQRWNTFPYAHCSSATDEIRSAYAQHICMMILKWVVTSSYAEHVRKLVTHWLSMRENWLLDCWACATFVKYIWPILLHREINQIDTLKHGVSNCLPTCLYYIIFVGDIYAVRYGRLQRKDTQFQNYNLLPPTVALDIMVISPNLRLYRL